MRIAFFVEGMSASGVDTSTHLLADALRALGHTVVLFHPWKERIRQEETADSVLLPGLRVSSRQPVYWSTPVSLKLLDRFRREHFDLIHMHTSGATNLLAWQLQALIDLPLVYTYHTMTAEYAHYLGPLASTLGGAVHPALEWMDRIVCNSADAIVAPSPKAERYLRSIGVKPPIHLIPNGVDLRRFHPERSTLLLNRFRLATDRPVLLWVGRLNQEKRPLLALDLFKEIHAIHPDCVFVLVGDGALRNEIGQRVAALGLEQSVFLYGLAKYAEMPHIYGSADLWISTSISEVHPMVAIEAAACGLPAIAWNDPALEGIVLPGETGILASCEAEFVSAACRLLENPALRARMGAAAQKVAASFRIETTAQRMAALYAAIVEQHARPRDLSSLKTYLASGRRQRVA